MYDILIRNGIVFDGTNSPGRRTDVAINGNKVVVVADMPGEAAREIIDATDLYVAPGFIDIQNHSDSHGMILNEPALESVVSQGITTVVIGQCGASIAPLASPDAIKSLQKWGILEGVNADWQSYAQFVERMASHRFGANILSFVGHATLRRGFTGDTSRILTPEEIAQIAAFAEKTLIEGAPGISFGFQYGHEISTSADEIRALAEVVKKHNKVFSVHLRSQDTGFLEAVREIVDIVKGIDVKLKISHFKVEGQANYKQLYPALDLIEQAYQKKTNIRFDIYPYTTTWRPLYTYLPSWAYEGGFGPLLKRLKDEKLATRIRQELSEKRASIGPLIVSSSPKVSSFIGKTLAEISSSFKSSPEDTLMRVLSSNNGEVIVFDHDVAADQLTFLIQHPLSFIGSDGVGYPLVQKKDYEIPHPRCFGTFPRYLRLMRGDKKSGLEKPLLSWHEAIAKITGQAADFLGLANRGYIKNGSFADIAIFNPATIADSSTYQNPYIQSQGMEYVIVNGKISLYSGKIVEIQEGGVLQV